MNHHLLLCLRIGGIDSLQVQAVKQYGMTVQYCVVHSTLSNTCMLKSIAHKIADLVH